MALSLKAEYRVYQYMVSSRLRPQAPTSVIVTSTLDPNSYIMYHGGNRSIRVNLLNTWMCKGHTGNKKPCDSPIAQLSNQLNPMADQAEAQNL